MSLPQELHAWAIRHHVSVQALAELSQMLGAAAVPTSTGTGSEGRVQSQVRLEASRREMRLWRNNVGVLMAENGQPVRFGLANDTKQLNAQIKSADLIGWRRLVIAPEMVGRIVAQFVSLECKHEGWSYTGNEHEQAQQRWAALVAADGGYAKFVTGAADV